jgi:hypothetical protein
MKKSFILIIGLLCFTTLSYSQNKEQTEIKKVCLAETKAFTEFDFDGVASYHVKNEEAQFAFNTAEGSFTITYGWETFSEALKEYFKNSKKESVTLTSDNFRNVIKGKMAFVSYDAISTTAAGVKTISKEYRTMLKIKGQWKILAEQVYFDFKKGK